MDQLLRCSILTLHCSKDFLSQCLMNDAEAFGAGSFLI